MAHGGPFLLDGPQMVKDLFPMQIMYMIVTLGASYILSFVPGKYHIIDKRLFLIDIYHTESSFNDLRDISIQA